ncbi:MAG: carboxylating nicotinate-nucleotide diphosphorylase, partial [Acidobacteriia bacterium]|nr:carboxylating nicotinate-nucleotide diphosphorylase [Terriglobia bacterium]
MKFTVNRAQLRKIIRSYLSEDLGSGDVTTNSIVPLSQRAEGEFVVKQACVVAGLEFAKEVFHILDPKLRWKAHCHDGQFVTVGRSIVEVEGRARALLTGERVALNILQHLSGIATATRAYVEAVRGTSAKVLDTRKTTPGLREWEKYAVRCGGGVNHRLNLSEAVLIKDNHIASGGGVREAVSRILRAGDGGQVSGVRPKVRQVFGGYQVSGARFQRSAIS